MVANRAPTLCPLTFQQWEGVHSFSEGGNENADADPTIIREPERLPTCCCNRSIDHWATCSSHRDCSKKYSLLRKYRPTSLSRTNRQWLSTLRPGRCESFDAPSSSQVARCATC